MDEIVYYYPEGHEKHYENGHPERPERIETIKAVLQQNELWNGYLKLAPIEIPDDVLKKIHSPAYLNLLEMTCRRSGHLDMDTYTTQASWELAQHTAGGAIAVATAICEGKSKRGFALTRPPGHHAMHGQGMGFCLINNIAVAAEYLIQRNILHSLAIVDLDLHHGNGTQDIFWKRSDVLYLSTHQAPFYPGTGFIDDIGEGEGEGWTANFPLPPGAGDAAFNIIMDELILPLLERSKPEMLLVSYGFDPHWMDPLGQLYLTANGYGMLVSKLCNWADENCAGKIGLFLEGGYDLAAGAACSLAVANALLGRTWADPYPSPYRESNSWQIMVRRAKVLWNL
jgi:acetoin utilization deacetylase AcuC-like enzyme